MTIRWITPVLGTAPALSVRSEAGINIIDVRDLVDKTGNRTDVVRGKIIEGCRSIRAGKITIVCCDYGISRSNAVAVGILAMLEGISFEIAVRRVLEATGEKEIKVEPLQAVRRALGENLKRPLNRKLRFLVTGSTGGIGRSVSHILSQEFYVFAPNRADLDIGLGSTQLSLFAIEKEIDCIVHLANPRVYTSNVSLGETLTMLRNILDSCVALNLKLIYVSCFEVYSGYRSNQLIADESLPLNPKGPYAETKYLCEMLIEQCRRTQGLRCAMLRSSTVYGIGVGRPKFIYNFIDMIKQSKPIVTHRYDNGFPALDLLYVDDLVAAVVKVIRSDFIGNLNIGTGVVTSTRKVAEILCNVFGQSNDIESALIDGDTACIAVDARKARDELAWQATIDVEEGLRLTVLNLKD
jgi:nucleoside-diphosphate-sugar epimerase